MELQKILFWHTMVSDQAAETLQRIADEKVDRLDGRRDTLTDIAYDLEASRRDGLLAVIKEAGLENVYRQWVKERSDHYGTDHQAES